MEKLIRKSIAFACLFAVSAPIWAQPAPQPIRIPVTRPGLGTPQSNVPKIPLGVQSQKRKGPSSPNIILIMADDLGWGELGSYGQPVIKTPYLDRMAAEGMRFTQAYAGSSIGDASRGSLFTGKHTGHAYIRGNRRVPLRAIDITIPQILMAANYETIALGKWNLGEKGTTGEPFRKGFRHWAGFADQLHANNYYPLFLWRYTPGTGGINQFNGDVPIHANAGGRRIQYSTDIITKMALNAIRIYKPAPESKYKPFFLYVSYTAPHANNALAQKTRNGMEVPNNAFPYAGERWPRPERNKAAMITRMDQAIGQILAKLREYDIEEDTVVFFTSDNGPHMEGGNDPKFFRGTGPFRGIKRSLYEGGIRVPMIVKWKGKVKTGSVTDQPFAFWDMLPTMLHVAKLPTPRETDGISLMPTLIGLPQKQQHEFLYWEVHENGSQQAVRQGDWKAVRITPGKPLELYNLETDKGETRNVAAQYPNVVKRFEEHLTVARVKSTYWPLRAAPKKSAQR